MQIALKDGGDAIVRVRFADWVKALCVLAVCLWGHAELQCSKIDKVAESMVVISARMDLAEEKLRVTVTDQAEFKADYRDTTRELRDGLKELNTYLRDQKASLGQ
jgi:hypothetical protein